MQFHEDSKTRRDRLNSLLKCSILRNLMFLIDRNSHYYMYHKYFKHNVRRCLDFFLSTLNFVSERDPDEIVQTHMLS